MELRQISEVAAAEAVGHLFDKPIRPDAAERFLSDERHHLLIAYEDGAAAGMITGVERTHPDKGAEMFLYELGVDDRFRRRGSGGRSARLATTA